LNRDFIAKIYQEHYEFVKLCVMNRIHTPKIADDVSSCVQDVFVAAMKAKGLENHPNIKGWLLLTVKNVVKNFNRQNVVRRKYYEYTFEPDINESEVPDFSDLLIERIEYERLEGLGIIEKIYESLSLNERDFYDLRYKKEFSIKKINEILDISKAAAATRCSRLNVKLKRKIKYFLENL
jgi:RNA polymerase sigma-70 factor (ECF subfamily)